MSEPQFSGQKTSTDSHRGFLPVLAIVSGLWAFSVVQPLFDLMTQTPQFLGVHDIGGASLLVLVAILLVPAPLALSLLIKVLTSIHSRSGLVLLWVTGVLLVTAGMSPVVCRLVELNGWLQIALSCALAVGICLLPLKIHGLVKQLTWLAVLPFFFTALFLFHSSTRSVLITFSPEGTDGPNLLTSTDTGSQTPVVLVIFDAFSVTSLMNEDMGIDSSLCPNLAKFADDATWYRNTMAASPSTIWAVPAIMTGRMPDEKSSPNFQWFPQNIFTWLAETHRVHAFESETILDPNSSRRLTFNDKIWLTLSDLGIISLHVLLPDDLATGVPSLTNDWKDFAGAAGGGNDEISSRQQMTEEFIASLEVGTKPVCSVLHVLIPHCPAQFFPSGNSYSNHGRVASGQGGQWGDWHDDLWTVIEGQQRHLLQVGYADHIAGRIIERLKEKGLYDKALVVFCADHGMGFSPGDNRRGVTSTNQGDILPVPLLIKYPGTKKGSIDDRLARTIDILPTIAGTLGGSTPWSDGLDLRNEIRQSYSTVDYVQLDGPQTAIVDTVMAQRDKSLRIKHQRFGPNIGSESLFAPLRGLSLLGQAVPTDLPLFQDNCITLQKKGPWISPDPSTGLIPAEVAAYISGKDALPAHCDLVVAVDGIVRVVARPYGRKPGSDIGIFSAILPEACVAPGEHSLRVLVSDWSEGEPRFFNTEEGGVQGIGANLVTSPLPNLNTFGLDKITMWNKTPTRWTNGSANLFVSTTGEKRPTAVQIKLASAGPGNPSLLMFVNGTPAIVESLGNGAWTGSINLQDINFSQDVRIGLFSRTFVPAEIDPGSNDQRNLGIAIQDIHLTDSSDNLTSSTHPKLEWLTGPRQIVTPNSDTAASISGIHLVEHWNAEPVAWTTAQTNIQVPWNHSGFPDHLLLSLADSGPQKTELSVTVNGHLVFQKKLDQRPRLELIDLQGVPQETPLNIRLNSDTFSPKDMHDWSNDDRELGVAFRLLTLFGQAVEKRPDSLPQK